MVPVEPREGAGEQETAHLVAAVIENERAPVLLLALARIGVLVQVRAVKLREGKAVAREMPRHPVQDHPDAALVQVVDKPGKILGRAVPVRRREKAGDLVAPGAVERVLGQWHGLDMGVAHFAGVVGQGRRQLPVGQRATGVLDDPAPRAQVHFVNRDGPVELFRRATTGFEPGRIIPLVPADVADDGGVVRRRLVIGRAGIGLQADEAALIPDLKLVHLALAEPGHEELPYPGDPERPHGMVAPVPAVEIADHRHPLRRGRPYRERHSGNAVQGPQVRPELGVNAMFVALVEEIKVLVAERGQERIRIKELADLTAVELDP